MLVHDAIQDFVNTAMFDEKLGVDAIKVTGDEVFGHAAMAFTPRVIECPLLGVSREEGVADNVYDPDIRRVAARHPQGVKHGSIGCRRKIRGDDDVRDRGGSWNMTAWHRREKQTTITPESSGLKELDHKISSGVPSKFIL